MATYEYTKEVNADRLTLEIKQSSITNQLEHITTVGDDAHIVFSGTLSPSDVSTLDTIIDNHVASAGTTAYTMVHNNEILVPFYVSPDNIYTNTTYNSLIDIKKKYHQICVTIILNVYNGPGSQYNANYAVAIKRLRGAGCRVVGYVSTNYCARSIADVKQDIDNWFWFYPEINGVVLSEMTYQDNSEYFDYYRELYRYTKAKGDNIDVIGNPGSNISYKYYDYQIADRFITWVNNYFPDEATMKGDFANGNASYSYNKRAIVVYGQTNLNQDNFRLARKYYGSIYITNNNTANPYDSLSNYFEVLCRTLLSPEALQFHDSNYITAITSNERLPDEEATDNALATAKAIKSYSDTKVLTKMRGIYENSIIVPMYIYPSDVYSNSTYNSLIDLKKSYHKVPMYVILNPANGPGTVVDGNYTVAIKRLAGAGIHVLGYIHTTYASRSLATVKADVDGWLSLYPEIEGIFVDEQTSDNTQSNLDYYTELTAYCHYKKFWPVIGNPGTAVYPEVYDTVDVVIVHENSSYPSEATIKGDWAGGNASFNYERRGVLVHTQSSFDYTNFAMIRKYAGLLYVTDSSSWTAVSAYMLDMLQTLGSPEIQKAGVDQWDDIHPTDIQLANGTASPDRVILPGLSNLDTYGFDGTTTLEALTCTLEIPHGYREGTDLYPHIHWAPINNNSGDVKWQMEYSRASLTGEFSAAATVSVTTAATGLGANGRPKIHFSGFPAISGSGVKIGDLYRIRLFRDPGDSADTYGSDALMFQFSFHICFDTLGSRQRTAK